MSNTFAIKYRPKHIDDVIGQEKSIQDIKYRMKSDAWAKAIVLSGQTGTGKSTCARIIAKSILCDNKDNLGNPCNICETCITIDEEKHSNYYFELNASNLGINEMRDIEISASQRVLGTVKAKVFVIDETQELNKNKQAQKNILKLLESQGDTAYFILGTMEDSKLVDAIKDRCTRYLFKPVTSQLIAKKLFDICKKENLDVNSKERIEILFTIAENSGGSVRRAISYLERVVYSELWTKEELLQELNIISFDETTNILKMLLEGNKEIFRYTLNEELLRKIRYNLMLLIKLTNGIKHGMTPWHEQLVKPCGGIVPIEKLIKVMEDLNQVIFLPYISDDVIEFTILKIVDEMETFLVSQKQRRRKIQE